MLSPEPTPLTTALPCLRDAREAALQEVTRKLQKIVTQVEGDAEAPGACDWPFSANPDPGLTALDPLSTPGCRIFTISSSVCDSCRKIISYYQGDHSPKRGIFMCIAAAHIYKRKQSKVLMDIYFFKLIGFPSWPCLPTPTNPSLLQDPGRGWCRKTADPSSVLFKQRGGGRARPSGPRLHRTSEERGPRGPCEVRGHR